MTRCTILFMASFSVAGLAAEEISKPVGRIQASGPVTVSRAELPPEAGAAPVVPGDEIVTTAFPAWLMLNGRNRVSLDKDSRARIEDLGDGVIAVRLLEGRLSYSLEADSKIAVFEGSRKISNQGNPSGVAQTEPPVGRPQGFVPPQSRSEFPGTAPPPGPPPSPSQPPQS